MAVKGDDNVIYANFGTRKRVSTPAEVNHVDRSGRILSTTAARIAAFTSHGADPVSYTHLTLPTIYSV